LVHLDHEDPKDYLVTKGKTVSLAHQVPMDLLEALVLTRRTAPALHVKVDMEEEVAELELQLVVDVILISSAFAIAQY